MYLQSHESRENDSLPYILARIIFNPSPYPILSYFRGLEYFMFIGHVSCTPNQSTNQIIGICDVKDVLL